MIQSSFPAGEAAVEGAVYDIQSGQVRWLP